MKKIFKKQIAIIVLTLLSLSTVVFAKSEEKQKIMIEKSPLFAQWEQLSEEERNNTIQPSYYEVNFKDSIKRSTYNQYLVSASTTEDTTRYNLEEQLKDVSSINVKNQQLTNSCWAFSFSNVIETTIAKKYNRQVQEYSPMHMEYMATTTYNKLFSSGGTFRMALANGASGLGPVFEEEFSFGSVYDVTSNSESNCYLASIEDVGLNQDSRARIEDATIFSPIYKTISNNSITYKDARINGKSYSENEVEAIRQLIKNHIMEKGAITTTLYTNNGNTSSFYNSTNKTYYYNGSALPDHAVTIVGWDDSISKDLFLETNKPINDGAYIVLNSWGTEFGNNGYFYVSYDDVCIEQALCGIVEITEKTTEGEEFYDNIYEYDQLGVNAKLPSVNADETELLGTGYAANVFTRKSKDKNEYLSEVGVFLNTAQGIRVYVNPDDENIEDCVEVASYTGTYALDAGYHVLKLSSPIQLTGDKFVVKIEYLNSDGVYIPLECNLSQSGLASANNEYDTAISNEDESFISFDGITWNDMYNHTVLGTTLKNTNACIKAFTTISEGEAIIEVEGITLDKETVTIEIGETSNLVATVKPTNATNRNVTWTSSNPDVASISEEGIIEALKIGTTKITVKTIDGGYIATCDITVSEKTNSEDDIYAEKEPGKIEQVGDSTVVKGDIPNAGAKVIMTVIIISLIVAVIVYKKYKTFEDIK